MGLQSFEINLDNPKAFYYAGQSVTGTVLIRVDSSMKVKGVSLKLDGEGKTHWLSAKNMVMQTLQPSSETEIYFNESAALFGHGPDADPVWIPEGQSEYRFEFKLPANLPSSFMSTNRYVHYFLEGRIESTGLLNNHRVVKPFTVNRIFDLNKEPKAKQIGEMSGEKAIGCLLCTSRPIQFLLKLPKIGYSPGEDIKFMVEISNMSSRAVTEASLTMLQLTKVRAGEMLKNSKNDINKITGPTINSGSTELWEGVLRVPSVPPSWMHGCRILDVQYYLTLELQIQRSSPLVGNLPIIIGTIPVVDTSANEPIEKMSDLNFQKNYPTLPPPTFDDGIFFGNTDVEGGPFIPKYTVFRNSS